LESNREKYQEAISQQDVDIFLHPWWLDIVCGKNKWAPFLIEGHNSRIDGIWPVPMQQNFLGKHISRQPGLTPVLGMRIFTPNAISNPAKREKFKQKTIRKFLSGLKKQEIRFLNQYFPKEFEKEQEFAWQGFRNENYSRYILESIKDHENIWGNFEGDIRANIKKAENIFQIKISDNGANLFPFIEGNILNSESFTQLTAQSISRSYSKVIYGKKDNAIKGACFILVDKSKAYLLCLGVDNDEKNSGLSSLLIWEGIQYASKFVDTFDFGGSMIPGISKFMQGFTRDKLVYLRMRYYHNQLTKILFTALNKD